MSIKALHQFPRGFLWGCATAAHQVEGQNVNDWWRWEQTPGHIYKDQIAGRACEWWNGRYIEDFDRAAYMSNNAQRISVEWSRIQPEPDKWDDWSVDRYREMIKALLDRGMKPMVTLHHFTNPLWVDDLKGWVWDETPKYFERYVRRIVDELKDLCSIWCTINEPMVCITQGYTFGKFPPGMQSTTATNRATLNMLRGHAAAYRAIKEVQPEAQVGYSTHHLGIRPNRPILIHWLAAQLVESFFNRIFMGALRDGSVRLPGSRRLAMPELKGTLDWIGLQYYQEYNVGFSPSKPTSLFLNQSKPTNMPVGPGSWGGLNPDAIFKHIEWLWSSLKIPIYITESGVPDPTDTIRPGYLLRTVRAMWRAVNFNFPVRGFFFWSLLDNFEWNEGYDPRFSFGLYQTNFQTQERTPRKSADLYREICSQNGLSSDLVRQYAPELMDKLFPGEAGKNDVKLKPK